MIGLKLVSILVLLCMVSLGSADGDVKSDTKIKHNVKTENYKIGNTKTKNYNIQQSNYQPTQLTQVVLSVPKLDKKSRKSRPPTNEEFAVKRRIMEIYAVARQGHSSPQMDWLGRVLEALNPKYIATERVLQAAFGDQTQFFAYLKALADNGLLNSLSLNDNGLVASNQVVATAAVNQQAAPTMFSNQIQQPTNFITPPANNIQTPPRPRSLSPNSRRQLNPRFKDQQLRDRLTPVGRR